METQISSPLPILPADQHVHLGSDSTAMLPVPRPCLALLDLGLVYPYAKVCSLLRHLRDMCVRPSVQYPITYAAR